MYFCETRKVFIFYFNGCFNFVVALIFFYLFLTILFRVFFTIKSSSSKTIVNNWIAPSPKITQTKVISTSPISFPSMAVKPFEAEAKHNLRINKAWRMTLKPYSTTSKASIVFSLNVLRKNTIAMRRNV